MNHCKDCKHFMPDMEVQGVQSAACALTSKCVVSGAPVEPDSCWTVRHRGACGLVGALFVAADALPSPAAPKGPKRGQKATPKAPVEEAEDGKAE